MRAGLPHRGGACGVDAAERIDGNARAERVRRRDRRYAPGRALTGHRENGAHQDSVGAGTNGVANVVVGVRRDGDPGASCDARVRHRSGAAPEVNPVGADVARELGVAVDREARAEPVGEHGKLERERAQLVARPRLVTELNQQRASGERTRDRLPRHGAGLLVDGLLHGAEERRREFSDVLGHMVIEMGAEIGKLRNMQRMPVGLAFPVPDHLGAVPHQAEGDRREHVIAERRGRDDRLAVAKRPRRHGADRAAVRPLRQPGAWDEPVEGYQLLFFG